MNRQTNRTPLSPRSGPWSVINGASSPAVELQQRLADAIGRWPDAIEPRVRMTCGQLFAIIAMAAASWVPVGLLLVAFWS